MADKIEFNFFENFQTALIGNADMFLGRVSSLISYISPLITAGLGIYIILQAYHYYSKGLDETILDISRRMVGWILIAMLALNASNYQKIATMIWEFPDEIASAVNGTEFKGSALDTSRKTSDDLMENLHKKAEKPLDGLGKLGKYFIFGLNMTVSKIFAAILLLIVFVYYLIAKIFLLMSVMVGPIFIGCLFFPATRQWGMNWINQIANYTITIVLYIVLAMIQKNFFDSTILGYMRLIDEHPIAATGAVQMVFYSGVMAVMFLLSTIVFGLVAMRVPTLASALTGGATLESGIGRLANTVTGSNMYKKAAQMTIGKKGKVEQG